MSLNHWPQHLKPREKLLNQGAESLTDAELLAIFLRTGIVGMDVVELATSLLQHFGSLNKLFNADADSFCQTKGMGEAKYVQLQAVLEMSKRYFQESMFRENVLDSPDVVKTYLHQLLRDETYEQFLIVYLDNQHRVICHEVLFTGTIDAAAVYPRVVIDAVIKHKAAAVIFAHNHPSGISEPSHADINLTNKLKQALTLIDVRTLDHFVVGYNEVVSFAERGLL